MVVGGMQVDSELEKIDLIRARLGVGYKEAKEALDAAGGDVVQALIRLEERNMGLGEKLQNRGQEVVDQIREMFARSNETRVKIKQGERTVLELPASVGALGVLGTLASSQLAVLGALGAVAAMAKNYSLEIERPEEEKKRGPAGEARPGEPAGPT